MSKRGPLAKFLCVPIKIGQITECFYPKPKPIFFLVDPTNFGIGRVLVAFSHVVCDIRREKKDPRASSGAIYTDLHSHAAT